LFIMYTVYQKSEACQASLLFPIIVKPHTRHLPSS
jgi:hypothetical protein